MHVSLSQSSVMGYYWDSADLAIRLGRQSGVVPLLNKVSKFKSMLAMCCTLQYDLSRERKDDPQSFATTVCSVV